MNVPFWPRRGSREFAEAIRPELKSLPTPKPRQELLARILASRDAGTRVILPDVVMERERSLWRHVTAATIAAVFLLVVVSRQPSSSRGSDEDFRATPILFGQAAFAQTERAGPALPPATFTRADAIHPVTLRFLRRIRDITGTMTEVHGELVLVLDSIAGVPAWRVALIDREAGTTRPPVRAETLYIARSNLALLRRAVHISPYRRYARINIQQQFAGDSITGRMTTDGPSIGEGRVIARKLQRRFGPYIPDAFGSLFLMAAPLDRGWRGSASLLGWAVIPNDVFLPMELRVEGEEAITVPAGTFDCWRMTIRFGGRTIFYWARKTDGLGVRVYDDSQASTTGTRETLLVSVR